MWTRSGELSMSVVAGVVVTYLPERGALVRLLQALSSQVERIFLVDNGPNDELGAWILRHPFATKTTYMPLHDNTGIGAAQNEGIRAALAAGATHVALFDQDSVPAEGMISKLLEGEERLLRSGESVGAVGPQLLDEETGRTLPFVQFRRGLKRWVHAKPGTEAIETHHLVSSGTMISARAVSRVGFMREDFFLEYVDVEWGLRARAKGFKSFGIASAKMLHNLGDSRVALLFGLKSVPVHSPQRHYYTMRNAVCMLRLAHVPGYWKVHDTLRTVLEFLFFGSCIRPRMHHIHMMLRGLRDGCASRMGRYRE